MRRLLRWLILRHERAMVRAVLEVDRRGKLGRPLSVRRRIALAKWERWLTIRMSEV